VTGSAHAVTIRPEKIHMELTEIAPRDGWATTTGTVSKVVYLGAFTRFVVSLDVGGELVVMQQNLASSSMEALEVRDRRVWIAWERQHARPVEQGEEGSDDPKEEHG
jgi:ABC-type Fe3+/spermidine/putrescine transport system ATPase subunit